MGGISGDSGIGGRGRAEPGGHRAGGPVDWRVSRIGIRSRSRAAGHAERHRQNIRFFFNKTAYATESIRFTSKTVYTKKRLPTASRYLFAHGF